MQKRNLWQEALYWVLLLALLTAGGFLLFTNLGETGISDCDEARHGINAYEMMQSGDYVVTTYRGEPDYWNLKPPLTDYCIMLGYRIFGYNALGLRFYSVLSMMLTMIVLALWTRRRYGRIASLCTQLMLLGCGLIYGPHFARFGDADAQMLLFYVVAMICMLESRGKPRLLYGTALCFGLAFMSKSWHAALIPVTCLMYLVVTGEIRRLKPRHYLGLIFFGLLPIAPWAIARYQRDGMAFFEKMLSIDVVKRATTVHEDHRGGAGYYVYESWDDFKNDKAPLAFRIAHGNNDDLSQAFPQFSHMQYSVYLQDEINVSERFKATVGVRFEVPVYPSISGNENKDFTEIFADHGGYKTSDMPKARLSVAPRVGFNWDMTRTDSRFTETKRATTCPNSTPMSKTCWKTCTREPTRDMTWRPTRSRPFWTRTSKCLRRGKARWRWT